MRRIDFVEVCAGAGGLGIGFETAGMHPQQSTMLSFKHGK